MKVGTWSWTTSRTAHFATLSGPTRVEWSMATRAWNGTWPGACSAGRCPGGRRALRPLERLFRLGQGGRL